VAWRFMKTLCEVYRQQDLRPQALAMAREMLALASTLPQEGQGGRVTNQCYNQLIYLLTEMGRKDAEALAEAEALAREQIDILQRTRGGAHSETLKALNGLAWLLFEAKRYPEALPLAEEAVAGYRQARNPPLLDRINTTDTLACVLCKLDRPADAEPLFREVLQWLAQGKPPHMSDGDAGLHALHYGECLLLLKRYPEAEAQLLEALRAAGQTPGNYDEAKSTVQTARKRLVEVYDFMEAPEKAATYRDDGPAGEQP
jgi:tetratricopeptide (TPR) repeat protein